MVISKWTWIITNLLWKQFVTLFNVLSYEAEFLLQKAELCGGQAKKEGTLPLHCQLPQGSRQGAHGQPEKASGSRDLAVQLAGAEQPAGPARPACYPCKAHAAGCQGRSRFPQGHHPHDPESCHRTSGQRLRWILNMLITYWQVSSQD